MNKLIESAKALRDKLDLIEKDGQFKTIFEIAYMHGRIYTGPNYAQELKDLDKALKELEKI